MADFYVKRGDHQFGPYKSSRLKQHADDGRVLPSDLVRQGEDGKWYPASSVKGLFSKEPVRQSADAQDATSELDPEAEDEAMALLMQSTDVSVAAPSTATAQDASPSSTPTEAPQPADTNSNLDACPDCGTMVSKRAAACPSCGAPLLEAEDSPELKACRDCGTMVPEQLPACPRCGVPFWNSERETTPRQQSPRQRTGVLLASTAVVLVIVVMTLVALSGDRRVDGFRDWLAHEDEYLAAYDRFKSNYAKCASDGPSTAFLLENDLDAMNCFFLVVWFDDYIGVVAEACPEYDERKRKWEEIAKDVVGRMKALPLLWIKNNRLNKSVLEQNRPTLRSIAINLSVIEKLLPPTDDHFDFIKNWINAMREAVEEKQAE